jgi:hypothetical protein
VLTANNHIVPIHTIKVKEIALRTKYKSELDSHAGPLLHVKMRGDAGIRTASRLGPS